MKKLYWVICGKYKKFEKSKISYVLEKTLFVSINCSKCKNEDEKRRRFNWDIKNSWFTWKYAITLKMWQKKT